MLQGTPLLIREREEVFMDQIRVEKITKTFTTYGTEVILDHGKRPAKTRTVLSDLTVEFPLEKLTVIVGRSGCGKSTLLQLLNGKTEPDSGNIWMPDGFRTALLSPDPYVITWTSVTRNVAMAGGAGRDPEERMAMAEKLVKLVRLEEFADLTPQELSTGMKQRLGLARVLASQAQVLLLDEPFASLDFITRAELQQELLSVQREMPRTIILVTHQLDEALLLGQRIVVMHGDSSVRAFDLEGIPYPRDLMSPGMLALKQEITEECRI